MARSSLDELLLDYEDFLRQRHLPLWGKDSPAARKVRGLWREVRPPEDGDDRSDRTDQTDPSDIFGPYSPWLNHTNPAIVANAVICMIHQANYLLDRQLSALERDFIQEGGYSEQLAAARIAERQRKTGQRNRSDMPNPRLPACPLCGKLMALRTARQGKRAGSQFWGCPAYPACKGTRPLEGGNDQADRTDQADGPMKNGPNALPLLFPLSRFLPPGLDLLRLAPAGLEAEFVLLLVAAQQAEVKLPPQRIDPCDDHPQAIAQAVAVAIAGRSASAWRGRTYNNRRPGSRYESAPRAGKRRLAQRGRSSPRRLPGRPSAGRSIAEIGQELQAGQIRSAASARCSRSLQCCPSTTNSPDKGGQ